VQRLADAFDGALAEVAALAREQPAGGVDERVEPWLGFALYVVALYVLPVEIPYAQDNLNRLWQAELGRTATA
jgi:hypothetical protein